MANRRDELTNAGDVLIAEDSATQAQLLQHFLQSNGFSVAVASNGQEALEKARQKKPILIISDILMPVLNGFDFCRQVKADSNLRSTPVILLTELSTPQDVVLGLECGADNFVRKPFDETYLLQRIHHLLTNQALRSSERVQFGIEVFLGNQRHFITAERQQVLDMLVSTYEQAVQLNHSLERSNESLSGLYRIAEGLNECTSEQEVLDKTLERVIELPGVTSGWVFLAMKDGAYRLAASRGLPPALEAPGAFEGPCLCMQQLSNNEDSRDAAVIDCERLVNATLETCGLRCHASIPLGTKNGLLGVLNIAGGIEGLFSKEDLRRLSGVAHQVGQALERARLHAQLEQLVDERTAALTAEVAERRHAEEEARLYAQRAHELYEQLKEREETLRNKSELLEHLLSISPTVIYCLAIRDGLVFEPRWVSGNLTRITGWAVDEALETGWWEQHLHPEEHDAVMRNTTTLFDSDYLVQEYRLLHKDGHFIWVHDEMRLLRDSGGNPIEAVGSWTDITNRKDAEMELRQVEEQFHQAQKMESIGSLAGGIAHDLNNVFAAVNGYTELIMADVSPGEQLYDDLQQIRDAGQRGANLVRQILAFSRRQAIQLQALDLNRVVTEFQKMLQRLIGEDIQLRVALDKAVHVVSADIVQIEQVLMNLAVNARDAMPDGGMLSIETANVLLDEAYAAKHVDVQPGPHVMLAVSDTGCGMSADVQKQIFEPFFTTKEAGQGTGLGLATVYGIVKQHRGNIWVYSEPGRGTTFKIYLPAVLEPAAPMEPVDVQPLVSRGTETVLVVEDETSVRDLICAVLSAHGYQTLSSGKPESALEIAGAYTKEIQLLLTDVIMPGMTGRDLARKMTETRPSIRVLYISGYTDSIIGRHGILDASVKYLQKPFTIRGLLAKVRECLDSPGVTPNP